MKAKLVLPILLAFPASAALAHGGVQNAAVLARMDAMKAIGDATKTLGEMAKGAVAFDADAARAAAQTIAMHAGDTPALFEAREDDPKSEALPGIWEDFEDFTARANDLERLAGDLATGLDSPEALRAGLGQLGQACKACHTEYRE